MYLLKKKIKEALYRTLAWEPFVRYQRTENLCNKIIVLMYHEIADDHDDIEAWTVVRKNDFVKQMEYLRNHYRIISLEEAIEQKENLSANQKSAAVVTFDDGYAGNKQIVLPLVKEMNIPVTIFVTTGAVKEQKLLWYDRIINAMQREESIDINLSREALGRYEINRTTGADNWREIERLLTALKGLGPVKREEVTDHIVSGLSRTGRNGAYQVAPLSIEEVRELAACPLITIGAHSHCHNILTQLSREEIIHTIQTSKKYLELWINKPVHYFAYPNGDYDDKVVGALRESGFRCGLTTISRPWERTDSYFSVPRVGIGRYDSIEYFKVRIAGGRF